MTQTFGQRDASGRECGRRGKRRLDLGKLRGKTRTIPMVERQVSVEWSGDLGSGRWVAVGGVGVGKG